MIQSTIKYYHQNFDASMELIVFNLSIVILRLP